MDNVSRTTFELLQQDVKAQRDHEVALELYELSQRIEDAHPRISKRLRQSAEFLLKVNEHRMEGIAMALRAKTPETHPG